MSEQQYELGMIGLGTMGLNLLLNMADHGHFVAGYSDKQEKIDHINSTGPANLRGFSDRGAFILALKRPRVIMLLVPAGNPVDSTIEELIPLLNEGDFIIDAGNSLYKDTDRRFQYLKSKGLGFMGMGVSGGETGARRGPSMMPGGAPADYARIQTLLENVSAKFDGEPCVALMGNGAAGHYVKMVHNGIEYGLMQMLSEVYDLMHRGLGVQNDAASEVFGTWNEGRLASFLVEITRDILAYQENGTFLVDEISDKAKAKGTGKWTSQDSMDLGIPIPTIDAAVAARMLSNYKSQREAAEQIYSTPASPLPITVEDLEAAYFAAMVISYAQGIVQIRAASEEYGYDTNLETVATVWRAGCIIRSKFLEPIRQAFAANPNLENLLLSDLVAAELKVSIPALRKVVVEATTAGFAVPSLAASLAYFDGFRTGRSAANLIQAQRDYFGAHTFEKLGTEGSFHSKWGQG